MTTQRVVTVANPDFEVATFFNKDGSADCVVYEKSGREAMHMLVPAPPTGMCIAVIRGVGGVTSVVYREETQ